jgi:hypothetical protein
MNITHGKRPSKDRAEPVSAGIPHFWPKRKHRDRSGTLGAARPDIRSNLARNVSRSLLVAGLLGRQPVIGKPEIQGASAGGRAKRNPL